MWFKTRLIARILLIDMRNLIPLKILRKIFLFAVLLPYSAVSQEQCDFDGDGISDNTTLSATGTVLTWNEKLSSTDTIQSENFGITTDQISPAHWLDQFQSSLGIVRIGNGNKLTWKILLDSGLLAQKNFGKAGNAYISGADFDGNGISDAAIVESTNAGLKWTVKLNMFSDSEKKTVKFILGKKGDRVLFLNPEGEKDWAGVFGSEGGKAVLTLRNLSTKKNIHIKRLNRKFTQGDRPRPFPIKSEEGNDAIGLLYPEEGDSDSTLFVYDIKGRLISKIEVQGIGTATVGNYNPDEPGEEVLVQTSSDTYLYNPFSEVNDKDVVVSGTVIDEINIENVRAPTPLPTATAQATATATPEPTQTPG